jgi:hypothetical protein
LETFQVYTDDLSLDYPINAKDEITMTQDFSGNGRFLHKELSNDTKQNTTGKKTASYEAVF